MFLVQCSLRVFHITLHGLEDDPGSTEGCQEGPWNGAKRVEVAAIDDPANGIDGERGDSCLYEREVP